jgi:hypothetical protein
MTGVVMGLSKKLDVNRHLLVSQCATRPVRHAVKGDFSALQLENTDKKRTFAEDFLFEHSVSAMHIMKIGITSGASLSANERSESCQQFGFPS